MTWKWNCKHFSFFNISLKGSQESSDEYVNAKWSETETGATTAKISKQHWD